MANKKGTRPASGSEEWKKGWQSVKGSLDPNMSKTKLNEMKGNYQKGFGQRNQSSETSGGAPPTENARLREAQRLPGGNGRVDEMLAKDPALAKKVGAGRPSGRVNAKPRPMPMPETNVPGQPRRPGPITDSEGGMGPGGPGTRPVGSEPIREELGDTRAANQKDYEDWKTRYLSTIRLSRPLTEEELRDAYNKEKGDPNMRPMPIKEFPVTPGEFGGKGRVGTGQPAPLPPVDPNVKDFTSFYKQYMPRTFMALSPEQEAAQRARFQKIWDSSGGNPQKALDMLRAQDEGNPGGVALPGGSETNPRGVPGQGGFSPGGVWNGPAPGSSDGGPGSGGAAQSPYLTMQGGKGGYSVDEWNGLKAFISQQPPEIQKQIMAGIDGVPGQGGQKFDYLLGQIKKYAGGGAGQRPVPPGSGGDGGGSGQVPRPDAGVPQGAIVNNWNPKDPAWVAKTEAKFGPGTVQKVQQAMNAAVAGIPDDGSGRRRVAIYNVLKQFGLIPAAADENPGGQGGVPGMGPAPQQIDPYTQVLGGTGTPPTGVPNQLPTLAPPPGQQPNVAPVNPYSFFSPF